ISMSRFWNCQFMSLHNFGYWDYRLAGFWNCQFIGFWNFGTVSL
ncbi:15785_t:CDS:1, partial [Cetraspora pellucida]